MFGGSMPGRFAVRALLLPVLVAPFFGCGSSNKVDSIVISPTTVTLGTGATVQLTAIGTINHGSHPASQEDITDRVTWASSIVGVADVSSSGFVTGNNAGLTTITASLRGYNGLITSNTTSITVPSPTGPLISLAVTPASQTVAAVGETVQFLAIASLATGATKDVTTSSRWTSSAPSVAMIDASTGVATTTGVGSTTITAIATNPDGSDVSGSATLTVTLSTSAAPLVSVEVIQSSQTATKKTQSAQFVAIGHTASGDSIVLSNGQSNQGSSQYSAVEWSSSDASKVSMDRTTGLAKGIAVGSSSITATVRAADGTILTGTAAYTVTGVNSAHRN